ncbi:MAG TPA: GNAT family N-acetyltransferase [Acidimicrobiales bacterium]|nr:GNAT family N-acetyltransferase [Acidimicrobiales bacterium]
MAAWQIRARTTADDGALRAVNAANVPEVGPLDGARLELFATSATAFDVVELDGLVVGVFVGLAEGLPYESPNYRWFAERHDRFAYVDRIALQPAARGLGIADELYDRFERWAAGTGRTVACAEVNVVPPNPRSLRFHERRGFRVVGELAPYGTDERVAMVEKQVGSPG